MARSFATKLEKPKHGQVIPERKSREEFAKEGLLQVPSLGRESLLPAAYLGWRPRQKCLLLFCRSRIQHVLKGWCIGEYCVGARRGALLCERSEKAPLLLVLILSEVDFRLLDSRFEDIICSGRMMHQRVLCIST